MEVFEQEIVNECLKKLAPSEDDQKRRTMTEGYIRSVIQLQLDDSVRVDVFGSGPLKTYLPKSDIDITVVYTDMFLKGERSDSKGEVSQ
jgi:DNA polymerase sigma